MDQDLVVRVQRGDQRAFEALVMADHPRLFRAAFGILRSTWRYFLAGQSISDWVVTADGSVWVLADKEGGKDLYVITPDAVADGG